MEKFSWSVVYPWKKILLHIKDCLSCHDMLKGDHGKGVKPGKMISFIQNYLNFNIFDYRLLLEVSVQQLLASGQWKLVQEDLCWPVELCLALHSVWQHWECPCTVFLYFMLETVSYLKRTWDKNSSKGQAFCDNFFLQNRLKIHIKECKCLCHKNLVRWIHS